VDNLKLLFDQRWPWQLREIEEYRFLVRFPPHKQIATTLISDTTYFKMKKEGVLVSLKAWTSDVESYETLEETWVQIRGVPHKWSNRKMFSQIASSLGRLIEIDWNSLFSSFFSMIMVKVGVKDVSKIPNKKLFEMRKNMYAVQFKVEGDIVGDGGSDMGGGGGDDDKDNND
jgi:hypothetical protein